jgi:hypothetical protein
VVAFLQVWAMVCLVSLSSHDSYVHQLGSNLHHQLSSLVCAN